MNQPLRPSAWTRWARTCAATVVTILCAATGMPAARAQQPASLVNVMSLSASATAEVPMDLMTVTLSTTRDGSDAQSVQAQVRQALDVALVEARRAVRPGQLDVQTGAFSLSPRYGQSGTIQGWQGRAELILEGRDLQAVAQLAGRLPTLTVARTVFGLSREKRQQVETEVVQRAIESFRERAMAQSRHFGFTGFTLLQVQVVTPDQPSFMPMPAPRMMVAAAPPGGAEPLPVEAGRATVTAQVSGSVQMTR